MEKILTFFISAGLSFSFFMLGIAHAGTVLVPTAPLAKRPAADLVYQGRPIDVTEATRLIREGFPVDTLSPGESILFTRQELPRVDPELDSFPAEDAQVSFDSQLASPRGLFRVSVDAPAQDGTLRSFTLTAALNAPSALMRASILRRMGYRVSNPKAYRRLKISFGSIADRDQFLEKLADRTLTSRARWIVENPTDRPEVVLQGVVLEKGRIQTQTVHWGLTTPSVQRDRRVFRALLIPFVLADLPEKVNQYAWSTGRLFSEGIWLEYLFSDAFPDVTFSDLKWAVRRLARLTAAELAASVGDAKLPSDVSVLVTERLKSRRNGLVELFGLQSEFSSLPVDPHLDLGNVVNGQLTAHDYSGYPQNFFEKPSLPPLRFSQMWRYFLVEGISTALGEGLKQINSNLLTLENESSAVSRHQQEVHDGVASYLVRTGGLDGFQQTTGVWAKPLFGLSVNASRSVVAGTLLGSDSQVQLVDTLSADANAGVYLGFDGIQNVVPGMTANVQIGRSYTHLRPISDVSTALTTNWGRLAVSSFMANLASALNPDIECEIPEAAHAVEFEIDGVKYTRIKYDAKRANGEAEAQALRRELIRGGLAAEKVLLFSFDREADCKTEVDTSVKGNLEKFMEDLAVGESFIITDYIKFGAGVSANFTIPIAEVIGLSIGTKANKDYRITRSTIVRKTASGFQIYLQDRRVDDYSFGIDINLYIQVVSFTRTQRHGQGTTEFFQLETENADTDTRRQVMRALRALLQGNSAEVLTDHFRPYTVTQDTRANISRFKFLAWSRDLMAQKHEVDIYPPADPQGGYDREANKRTLHMRRSVTRDGKDLFGLGVDVVSTLTGGIGGSIGSAGSADSGNAVGGSSTMMAISAQGEVTPGRPLQAVGMIEQVYRGWRTTHARLFDIFSTIERALAPIREGRTLFRRELFEHASTLQLYQLETTVVLYPKGLDEVVKKLMTPRTHREAFIWLVDLYGWERLRFVCNMRSQLSHRPPNIWYRDWTGRVCSPPWITELMHLRQRGLSSDARERLGDYQKIFSILVGNLGAGRVLENVDPNEYFFLTRVSGFRNGDFSESGEYVSDTVGHYDNEIGMGIYRDIVARMGISSFEIYGRFFTDGL